MNEQRQQAYLNIINKLLSCNEGDEPQIFQDNQEFVDLEFVEVMIGIAQQYGEAGREEEARWLISMAQQLAEALGLFGDGTTDTSVIFETYLNFLMELLQKVVDNPNPQLIYPFLAQNLDRLDENLIIVLNRWAKETLSVVNIKQAKSIAEDIFIFSNLISQFSLGNIVINKEIAISSYKIALKVYTFDTFPYEWANVKNNLGSTYSNRIKGDRVDNLEKAIDCYQGALKIQQVSTFPVEWAMTQNNLGNAYSKRIKGDRVDNLEKAIDCYQQSFKVYTSDAFPYEWARSQNNLGIAYTNRIKGEKAENLEIAISCCRESLKVYTPDIFSFNWANTQSNLGNAYLKRIKGEKAENLETAIDCYQESLKIYTPNTFPVEWANSQNNLGIAYTNRIKGEKAENLEIAISCCRESLKVYTPNTFPYNWANNQNNLGNAYFKRIKGEKADNLEIAINYYQESLKVYQPNTFPYEWANTQNNLGNIYNGRVKGEKADNLEIAIDCCQESLKVYQPNTFPIEWANNQNNLGNIYTNRIKGEKADNLEIAINYYHESLKIYQPNIFPIEWAMIQNNLGNVYTNRIKGEKADNLEIAINYYHESLKVYTPNTFPYKWAMTQNNLGTAYCDRIRDDKADNLEKTIEAYQKALQVYTLEAFPYEWANTFNNLGIAYRERIKGNKTDNLEKAIEIFQQALCVRTLQYFPYQYAETQNNLGTLYRQRIKGEPIDNLEKAIDAYQKALQVYTLEAFPYEWARTQINLGSAYSFRIKEDKEINLEKCLESYQKALNVYTKKAFPQEWAGTQNNLATCYSERIKGHKVDNLERAIKSYHNALEIRTKENDPLKCLQTARNLANLHYKENQWQTSIEAYHLAIEALENIRLEALNPQSRQEILSNAIDVFHHIVQAHLQLNQLEKALEYIERSKGRNLVELITQKNLQPQGVDQETINKLTELKQTVVNEQICLQKQAIYQDINNDNNLMPYIQNRKYLKKNQQELNQFIEQQIKPIDPFFSLTQKVEPISFTDIKLLIDAETCILQWYITDETILAFVVSNDGCINYWNSSEEERNKLIVNIKNYLEIYYSETGKQEWINQLPNLLQVFAEILNINDILALIPDACKRLIIIPHWFLHILPLHAFPIYNPSLLQEDMEVLVLQDKYDIQYAPSCQILQITKQRQLNKLTNLFAIQNPTKDLPFTDLEVNVISTMFNQSEIIAKDNATKDTVNNILKSLDSQCYHFSCHGYFNPKNALESALLLSNNKLLNLGEIFELNLKKSRLVVLSACETGLIDFNTISDEYIGLSAGFLFAGSPSVVSSLWTVSDLSTSFLMMKFYENLLDDNEYISISVALKNAQNWLRTLTVKEFQENLVSPAFKQVLNQLQDSLSFGDFFELEDAIAETDKRIKKQLPDDKPFANPFYWAAFTAVGT